MYNIYVKITIDYTTTVGISYKELYICKWYIMKLTKNKFTHRHYVFINILA